MRSKFDAQAILRDATGGTSPEQGNFLIFDSDWRFRGILVSDISDFPDVALSGELGDLQVELDAHEALTTGVHGIVDASLLETIAGATAKAAVAQAAAISSALASLSTHEADTTGIHGIADTTLIETITGSIAKANAAQAAAISSAGASLASHEADSTAVHGIANTASLVLTGDARLSDARTPTAHTHPSADLSTSGPYTHHVFDSNDPGAYVGTTSGTTGAIRVRSGGGFGWFIFVSDGDGTLFFSNDDETILLSLSPGGIFSGILTVEADSIKASSFQFSGGEWLNSITKIIGGGVTLPAGSVTGALAVGNIPNLPASKITSGTFPTGLIDGDTARLTADLSAIAAGTTVTNVGTLNKNVVVNDEFDIEWWIYYTTSVTTDVLIISVAPSAGTCTGSFFVLGANGAPDTGAAVGKQITADIGAVIAASANSPGNLGSTTKKGCLVVRAQFKQTVANGTINLRLRAVTNAGASSGTVTVKTQSQMTSKRLAP